MRILFAVPTLGTGGAEKLTVSYALGMMRRGHEVSVAFGFADSQADPLRRAGVELHEISGRRLKPRTLVEWAAGLRAAIELFQPDVVHSQSVTAAVAVRLAARRLPQLVTIHGISRSNEGPAAVLLRGATVKVTAVSEASAAGLRRHRWSPAVEVLGPGIDIAQLADAAGAEPAPELIGEPRLCCVARQDRPKGIDLLLRALEQVARELPRVGLTVVGTGAELERNRQLAASLGLAERVHFTDLIPNAAPYIRVADAVVLPSRREGLPVVALEALALERPVVATRVGGTPKVVVDGETGWLVPPEDVPELARAIVACLADPREAARRAAAGRRLVEERFGAQGMLDRIEELLRELAHRGVSVPSPKPRAYHRAVRAHQRARITVSKARRTEPWQGLRIFGYHRVSPDDDFFSVTPEAFRAQMEHLAGSDLTVVSLAEAVEMIRTGVEGRFASITFDDGYLDNLEHAVPVLGELDLTATIFAISDVIAGNTNFNWYTHPPPALGVAQVRDLLAGGRVDLQAHSRTHPCLTLLTEDELEREVAGSKEELEKIIGAPVSIFSYPAGIYGAREVRAVQRASFRAAVTTRPGVNTDATPLHELRRTMIYWRDSPADFAAKLMGALDQPSYLGARVQSRRSRPRRERGKAMRADI